MSLSDKQFTFAKNVIQLLVYAMARGWKFTLGEVLRPEEMQKIYLEEGKTTVEHSLHEDKLAIDINFFKNVPTYGTNGRIEHLEYELTYKKEDLQELGDFWESLNSNNEWGGNWKTFLDTPHFQMNK